MKDDLGLPLEYQQLPEYFDKHNTDEATEKQNATIENLLSCHGVKTVLDITCGTGSQVFFLLNRGYDVTGSDVSPDLLKIARQKALFFKGMDVKFIDGDMRTIRAGSFDAVISIFNAVGHLTKDDFEIALGNVAENLNEGGVFVFDIFNLQAMTDSVVDELKMDQKSVVKEAKIRNVQYSTLDRKKGRLTSYDTLTIKKPGHPPQTFKNNFTLQIYTAGELKDMLLKAGLETIGQYGMDGNEFSELKTLNILTVARKIK